MAIAVSLDTTSLPNPIDVTENDFIVDVIFTPSGTYTAGGDTINLSGLCSSNQIPRVVDISEYPPAGTTPNGYNMIFQPGTNLTNGVLYIFTAAGSQLTGSYPTSPVPAIRATFRFPKFV